MEDTLSDFNAEDRFFERLEEQLMSIETDEILKDLSLESLEGKGFMNKVDIQKKNNALPTEKEGLVFESHVDYYRSRDKKEIGQVSMEMILDISPVAAQACIASRDAKDTRKLVLGQNIEAKTVNSITKLYAAINGRVVICGSTIGLIPADVDSKVTVTIAPDQFSALVTISPSFGNGAAATLVKVIGELSKMKVRFGVVQENIEKAIAIAETQKIVQTDIVAALGELPIAGHNGTVEYLFDASGKAPEFKILPDGRIDYKNHAGILRARKGDVLAHLYPPGIGKAGLTVCGEVVAQEEGKPAVSFAGKGVTLLKERQEYVSEIDGMIILTGALIEVVDSFVVEGDVDYSTGNIDFNGTVIVHGSVLDGFEIKAGGDIVIGRNVESAKIEAGRDILIRGGVQGKGKGLISAGRNVTIDFVQNGKVEAQGSITIENFALNSYLYASKNLHVFGKRGMLLGGEVYIRHSIEVKTIGSEGGTKTHVECGTDFLVTRKIHEIDSVMQMIKSSHQKIVGMLRTVSLTFKKDIEFLSSKKEVLLKALEKKKDLEKRMNILVARRMELTQESLEKDPCTIKVRNSCFPNTHIKIKNEQLAIVKRLDSVVLMINPKTQTISATASR